MCLKHNLKQGMSELIKLEIEADELVIIGNVFKYSSYLLRSSSLSYQDAICSY